MERWDRRGDVRLDLWRISGGIIKEARCILSGNHVVDPTIAGNASRKNSMVSGGQCRTCPGYLHGACVAGRDDIGVDCSSRDRRVGWC